METRHVMKIMLFCSFEKKKKNIVLFCIILIICKETNLLSSSACLLYVRGVRSILGLIDDYVA
jgi:hypothetical protein